MDAACVAPDFTGTRGQYNEDGTGETCANSATESHQQECFGLQVTENPTIISMNHKDFVQLIRSLEVEIPET